MDSKQKVRDTFEEQLNNLGVDYLDRYLLHSIYSTTYDSKVLAYGMYGMFDFGREMKRCGKRRTVVMKLPAATVSKSLSWSPSKAVCLPICPRRFTTNFKSSIPRCPMPLTVSDSRRSLTAWKLFCRACRLCRKFKTTSRLSKIFRRYRGLQFLAGRETGKTWIDGAIVNRAGNDITELVRTAEDYLIEHTFL